MQTRAKHARAQLAEDTSVPNRETTIFGQTNFLSDIFSRLSATPTSRQGTPLESGFTENSIPRTPVGSASLRLGSTHRSLSTNEDISASPLVAERQTVGIGGFSASRIIREFDKSQRTKLSSNRDKTTRNSMFELNRIRKNKTSAMRRIDLLHAEVERQETLLQKTGHHLRGDAPARPQSEPQLGLRAMLSMRVRSPMLRSAPKLRNSQFCSQPEQKAEIGDFCRRRKPEGAFPPKPTFLPECEYLRHVTEKLPTYVVTPSPRIHRVYSHPVEREIAQETRPLSTPSRGSCYSAQEFRNNECFDERTTGQDFRNNECFERRGEGQRLQSNEGFGDAGNAEFEPSVEAKVVRRQASRCPQVGAFSDPWEERGALRTGAPRTSFQPDTDDLAEALGGGGMPGSHPEAERGLGVAPWRGQYLQKEFYIPQERTEANQPPVVLRQELSPKIPGAQVWEASRPLRRTVRAVGGGGVAGHAPSKQTDPDRHRSGGQSVGRKTTINEHERNVSEALSMNSLV
ncbi:uncharacterized protein [Leptinotarsa decemlineata]|uniref:uncharacterized protein n=1 Tax=Leptinotarsa decemlineata TaxID=7539 RepID=UPI003D30C43A